MQSLTSEDLRILTNLRDAFLEGSAGRADYWTTPNAIALYERFLGERIGWKWDAFLSELVLRKIRPKSAHAVDFGCGPGVASLRVLAAWPSQFTHLTLVDRSHAALEFARHRVRERFPQVQVETTTALPDLANKAFLSSHVFSELPPASHPDLVRALQRADDILWVESATHHNARAFHSTIREALRDTLAPVAPCPHACACPLAEPYRAADWCHFFAPVPTEVHTDPAWRDFSRALHVDLRSIPFTAIAMQRMPRHSESTLPSSENVLARRLAHPTEHKGYSKAQFCTPTGLLDLEAWKRDVPNLLKTWKRDLQLPLYHLKTDGRRILEFNPACADETRKA
jgi:SAM-dependent methyltransferase